MTMIKNRYTLFKITVSIILFAVSFYLTDPLHLYLTHLEFRWQFLLYALILIIPSILIRAYKIQLIKKTILEENVYNKIPIFVEIGTVAQIEQTHKKTPISSVNSPAKQIERILDVWVATFFILLNMGSYLTNAKIVIVLIAITAITIILYQIRLFSHRFIHAFPKKIQNILVSLTLFSWPLSNGLILLSFTTLILFVLQAYFLTLSLKSISIQNALSLFPIIYWFSFLPISISGIGVRELLTIFVLRRLVFLDIFSFIIGVFLSFFEAISRVIVSEVSARTNSKNGKREVK